MTAPLPPTPGSSRPLLPYLAACAIGLALALGFGYGAWVKFAEHRHMSSVGRTTDGTITGYKEVRHTGRRGNHLTTTFHPTFKYRVEDGREVEGTVPQPFELREIEIGQVMRVIYDPGDPTEVHLASAIAAGPGDTPWGLACVALLVGLTSLIGVLRLLRRFRA